MVGRENSQKWRRRLITFKRLFKSSKKQGCDDVTPHSCLQILSIFPVSGKTSPTSRQGSQMNRIHSLETDTTDYNTGLLHCQASLCAPTSTKLYQHKELGLNFFHFLLGFSSTFAQQCVPVFSDNLLQIFQSTPAVHTIFTKPDFLYNMEQRYCVLAELFKVLSRLQAQVWVPRQLNLIFSSWGILEKAQLQM